MNIVLATDDNFVQHCGVTIKSITTNNRDVRFFLLTEGLKPDNVQLLKNVSSDNGCSMEFCLVPSDIVKYFPMSKMASNHISIATYYRLLITTLLPDNVEKVIYLDCDMVIRDSLEELWRVDIDDYPLAAVYQNMEWADHNHSWERLNIPRNYGYFNAGCLLLNVKYLRNINFQDIAVEYINHHFDNIISHDQDVLNALFYGKAIILGCKWNYLSLFLNKRFGNLEFPVNCHYKEEKNEKDFKPIIVHFVSKPKPWNYGCDNPYAQEYYMYRNMTPWKGFEVKFNWPEYFEFKMIPAIKWCVKKVDIFNIAEKLYKLYKRSGNFRSV